jgi:hypothetical protein
MAVTPGACGQRMYPRQMQSLGYRAIQTQLMECAFDIRSCRARCTPHPLAPRKYRRVGGVTSALLCLCVQPPICWDEPPCAVRDIAPPRAAKSCETPMDLDLGGKLALITGGSRGIGRAVGCGCRLCWHRSPRGRDPAHGEPAPESCHGRFPYRMAERAMTLAHAAPGRSSSAATELRTPRFTKLWQRENPLCCPLPQEP